MRFVIIGTAGHIDHGKTALVKALTGIDTDRLKEEQERGITIELGFAHLALGTDLQAGIVDVPGHERFVKHMVAGTTGIDVVMMVVAADEGVMPQTREHLDICSLLGVKQGVVAATKIDLIDDPEWMKMMLSDLHSEFQGTFLQHSPIIPVSSRTGAGLEELRQALRQAGSVSSNRFADSSPFLAIDRVFTMRGFGTVVTGTLASGTLKLEDSVDILPDPQRRLRQLKIRGIQCYGRNETQAQAGQRVAINLSHVDRMALFRGQVLVATDTLEAGQDFDCTFQMVSGAKPLLPRKQIMFHTGTAKSNAFIRWLDADHLTPGQKTYARIHCLDPIAALPGQRYILRGFNPIPGRGTTVGGGEILTILPTRFSKKHRVPWQEELSVLESDDPEKKLLIHLRHAGYPGLDLAGFRLRSGLGTRIIQKTLEHLSTTQQVVKLDRERELFISTEQLEKISLQLQRILKDFHSKNPLLPGMPMEQAREQLGEGLDGRLFKLLSNQLIRRGQLAQKDDLIRMPDHQVRLKAEESDLEKSVRRIFERSNLAPPRPADIATEVNQPPPVVLEIIRHLTRTGVLVHIGGEMFVWSGVLADLRQRLIAHLNKHGEINTQEFKSLVGQSRKHVIPLAEYFDQEKITIRVGEKRVLRQKKID